MLEKVISLIAEQLGADESEISAESRFNEDLNADSLDLYSLVMAVEEEYNIEIPSEKLEDLKTVQDVIDYIESKQ
jgi:acyl carrier protein